ncbi:hypothetical protein [Zhongshania sp. BJYM1]|uniref:hypothetical protein n=1 Tax=Zhongshania aquatica TaxID=2965069 RepID=UPI0022B52E25|nr:hypothetical protein [Marortus sp. BJYM1]
MKIDDRYCFDYSISENDNETQLGESVAESIKRCIKFLAPILSVDEKIYLNRQADIALRKPNTDRSTRGDFHPISNKILAKSPIYAALAHYPVVSDPQINGVHPAQFLGDIARFAVILRDLGHITSPTPSNKAIADFARKISKAPQDAKELLYYTCYDVFETDFNIDFATHELSLVTSKSTSHTQQRGKVSTLHGPLSDILKLLRPQIQKRILKLRNIRIEDRKVLEILSNIQGKRKRDIPRSAIEDTPKTISLGDDEGPNYDVTIDEDERQFSVTRYNHWIRYSNLIAGSGREKALNYELKSTFEHLLSVEPSNDYCYAAQWLWMLTISNNRPFDAITNYFFKEHGYENNNGQIESITTSNNVITISTHHPIESKLDKLDSSQPQHELIRIRTLLPSRVDSEHAMRCIKRIVNEGELSKLIEEKNNLAKEISKSAYREFTESRVRGCLIHSVIKQKYDIPIAQLIFDEPLNFSYASLHYIAISNQEIQNIINIARNEIFGDLLPTPPLDADANSGQKVGSLIAQQYEKTLDLTSKWFCKNQRLLQKKGKQHWVARHNMLASNTQHIVFISTGHRGYSDFQDLRLQDLSLAAGIAIYRDKPSDPTILRRLVVLSKTTLAYIFIWIEHLEAIIQQKSIPPHVKEAAQEALNSTSPLFFTIGELAPHSIALHDPIHPIRGLIPKVPRNIARHLVSTELRRSNLKTMMLETHLGHNLALTINSPNGLLSPRDLHTEIAPAIDSWLADKGYITPPKQKLPKNIKPLKPPSALVNAEITDDVKKIRKLLKVEVNAAKGTISINKLVDMLLTNSLENYTDDNSSPPDPEKIVAIRKTLIESLPASPLLWVYACRVLRTKLRSYYRNKGWKIPKIIAVGILLNPPPRITCGHLSAYDSLVQIRNDFLKQVKSSFSKERVYTYTILSLLLFGPCTSIDQAKLWLKKIALNGFHIVQGSIVCDIDEDNGSRSISGLAAIFVVNWIQNCSKQRSKFNKKLALPYTPRFIEECVSLASVVEYPQILADVRSDDLISRELPASRLRAYFEKTCDPDITSMSGIEEDGPKILTRRKKKGISNDIESLEHYHQLRKIISTLPLSLESSTPKDRSMKCAINFWLSEAERPLLIVILANWVKKLIKPGANLKTGGDLLKKTVLDYIGDVHSTLADIPIDLLTAEDEEDAERLADIIDVKLSSQILSSDEVRTDRVRAISVARFFKEMGSAYHLANIKIYSAHETLLNIDAAVITENEIQVSAKQLNEWSKNRELSLPSQLALREASKAVIFNYNVGLRRSELRGLKPPQKSSASSLALKVRHNTITSIKTPAAWRNIEIPYDLVSWHPKSQKYLFTELAVGSNSYYAFKAIKNALQLSTGNPKSRLHHLRHTAGSAKLVDLLNHSLPSDRLVSGCRIASNFGHATLRSTMNYYGHLNHFLISQFLNPTIADIDHTLIATITGETETTIRQRWHRHKLKPTIFIASCIKTEGYLKQHKSLVKLADLNAPNPLRETSSNMQVTSLKILVYWIIERARGIPLSSTKEKSSYSVELSSLLLERLIVTQKQIGANLIEYKYLEGQLKDINNPLGRTKKGHSARIPKSFIDPLVENIQTSPTNLSNNILNGLSHIGWRGNKKITVALTHVEANTLKKYLNEINTGLILEISDDKSPYSIVMAKMDNVTISNTYIRIIILAIIVFMQF